MADLDTAIAKLWVLNERVPRPMRLPSDEEVRTMEAKTDISFSSDFKRYLLEASDVAVGALEPVTVTDPDIHTYLPTVLADARDYGVPADLIQICEDNGDIYCVTRTGEVVFWSHNGTTDERWPDLAPWIEGVWIGGADE